MQEKKKNIFRFFTIAVKWIFTIGFFSLIFSQTNYSELADSLHHAKFSSLLLAFSLTPFLFFCKIMRWYLLLSSLSKSNISFFTACRSYLIGLYLTVITPMGSGELARGMFISDSTPKKDLIALAFKDKISDIFILLFCLTVGWMVFLEGRGHLFLFFVSILLFVGVFFVDYVVHGIFLVGNLFSPWNMTIHRLSKKNQGIYLLLCFGGFGIFFLQQALTLYSFIGYWGSYCAVMPVITFSTILPLTIGGFGIREWTATTMLQYYHISPAIALHATITHVLMVMAIPVLMGYVLFLFSDDLMPT